MSYSPRFRNLPPQRQAELREQFAWLPDLVAERDGQLPLKQLSVSFFDHWLNETEALGLLHHVTVEQQAERDRRHAAFFDALASRTEVLAFRIHGRRQDRIKFRRFSVPKTQNEYLTQRRGQDFSFQIVLPGMNAACFSGCDDTSHFFFAGSTDLLLVEAVANAAGLFILSPDSQR